MGNSKIENGHFSQVTVKKENSDYINFPIVVIQDCPSCYMLVIWVPQIKELGTN